MLEFFTKQKLQRKGLSCGRKRREQSQSEWITTLRHSWAIRGLILCLFLAGLGAIAQFLPLSSAYKVLHQASGFGPGLTLLILVVSMIHFAFERPLDWGRNSRVLLVYSILLLQLALVRLVDYLVLKNGLEPTWAVLCAPYALAPILLTLLLGPQSGFFAVVYSCLFGSLLVQPSLSLPFVFLGFSLGMVGIWSTSSLRKRSQLSRAGFYLAVAGLLVGLLIGVMGDFSKSWQVIDWNTIGSRALVLIGGGLVTVTVVSGLLPLLEGIFRITTTISWIELSDVNHPLLRRMSLEAPGTYFHSQMVANLAENAAEAIGANGTQCRVCSYFHDIGKLERPEYCIENIANDENPHDALAPSMSALIIISHVKDGVDLAIKHKLNREITDAILQHHGNSLVYFFYRRAKDQQEEIKELVKQGKAAATDVPEVADSKFRYPGPKPQSIENAIISLADAVESASRTWGSKLQVHKLEHLVDEIVTSRLKDGQLDECDLSLGELELVKESFVNSLRTMHHKRIAYPEEKKVEKAEKPNDATKRPKDPARVKEAEVV